MKNKNPRLKAQNSNLKLNIKNCLERAVDFHGHLGPYLVLGLVAGDLALKKIGCTKYFGLTVKVFGADKKPKSCLIDGLQLSTGATYGKGNIRKSSGQKIRIEFFGRNNKRLLLSFKKELIRRLESARTHEESELLARDLLKVGPLRLFNIIRPAAS